MLPAYSKQLQESKDSPMPDVSRFVHGLFERSYPYRILHGGNHSAITNLLKRYKFASSDKKAPAGLSLGSIDSTGPFQAEAKLFQDNEADSIHVPVATGSESLSGKLPESNYVATQTCESILASMVQDHSLDQDFCLVRQLFIHPSSYTDNL